MRRITILMLVAVVLSACAQAVAPAAGEVAQTVPSPTPLQELQPAPTLSAAPTSSLMPTPSAKPTSSPTPFPKVSPTLLPEERPPTGATVEFSTDFSKHSVPYTDILSGGPPKDAIPAIDDPQHVPIGEADEWLKPREPVVLVEQNGQARAYPLQILMWHEIANDSLGDVPVAVTFCPLCNTAIAYDRRLDDRVLSFGTTGRLRFSNLVMYDRQTESWWQQATGEAIAGEHTGRELTLIPAPIVSWASFKETYPSGDVLSRDTGHTRSYGINPYSGYDDVERSPFLYDGPQTPGQLPAMARVITIDTDEESVAYPYTVLEEQPVINDQVGDTPIVVFWEPGTASALDNRLIAEGRDVGAASTFDRTLDDQLLSFEQDGDRIVDRETGSEWTFLGQAVAGPLEGKQLQPVVHINHFWFSWAAFRPETRVYSPEQATEVEPQAGDPPSSVEVGYDFEVIVYQGAEVLGGERIMFSEVFASGKPVVLNMWGGLCPICRAELPALQAAHERYGDRVLFVGLDVGPFVGLGSPEDGRALLDELGITYPAGTTPDPEVVRRHQVFGIPDTLFLTADGQLVTRRAGRLSDQELLKIIDDLLEDSDAF